MIFPGERWFSGSHAVLGSHTVLKIVFHPESALLSLWPAPGVAVGETPGRCTWLWNVASSKAHCVETEKPGHRPSPMLTAPPCMGLLRALF